MILFTFNLYKQINLFAKHIFANKSITIPYYIYSCFVRFSPLPVLMLCQVGALLVVPPPPPALEAACRISPARLLPSPGILLAVLHPLGGILPNDHRQGARTSLLSAAGSLAPESKLQE